MAPGDDDAFDEFDDEEYQGATTRMDFSGIREELKAGRKPKAAPKVLPPRPSSNTPRPSSNTPRPSPPRPSASPREELESFSTVKTTTREAVGSAAVSRGAPTPRQPPRQPAPQHLAEPLDDTVDEDEELPTIIVGDGDSPATLQEAPATRPMDEEDDDWSELPTQKHTISQQQIQVAIDRAKETTRKAKHDSITEETETPRIDPVARRPLNAFTEARIKSNPNAKTLQVPYDHDIQDEPTEDEMPTIVRDMGPSTLASLTESRRRRPPIERRMISPARGAPESTDTLNDDTDTAQTAALPQAMQSPRQQHTQQVQGGGARPATHPVADLDLDEILLQMEAQRRRSFWGPVVLFIVVAAATATVVWLIQ